MHMFNLLRRLLLEKEYRQETILVRQYARTSQSLPEHLLSSTIVSTNLCTDVMCI
jgi:hypothetical protein